MKLSNLLISTFLWEADARKKPNVIILLADDTGIGDISLLNKQGKIKTPNIDKIGLEGVNFLDAHAASTKCSPSRYMLMTGRYKFNEKNAAKAPVKPGQFHLGSLFKRNGYKTGIVGKTAPLDDSFRLIGDTPAKSNKRKRLDWEYKVKNYKNPNERGPGEFKISHTLQGNYTMASGAHTMDYDYAFLSQNPCCRVGGGYFENGVGVEPFSKFAIQRPYPEGSNNFYEKCNVYYSFTGEERCDKKPWANGYIGEPYFDERTYGPVLVPNLPPAILVQPSFDSRYMEDRINEKALQFIRENANKKDPFYLYYGFRAGHNPFNSPPRYRGKGNAGEVGENTIEMDDNVGKVMNLLKKLNIDEDTIVIFMSDNGAIGRQNAISGTMPYPEQSGYYMWDVYRHYQNAFDWNGQNYKLHGGKNSAYEGGNRLPFFWRYPRMIKPKVDTNSIVTYIDVYRTLAEFIGDENVPCNEAPDSRSLVNILTKDETLREPVVLHSVFQGTRSLRDGHWKVIPGSEEMYNLDDDMQELNNLWNDEKHAQRRDRMVAELKKRIDDINDREERSHDGRKVGVC